MCAISTNYLFLGILCWNATKAGERATQYCPSYIVGFKNFKGLAHRSCTPNGEWAKKRDENNETNNRTYTDYSACLTHDPEDAMLLVNYCWYFYNHMHTISY